MSVDKPRAIFPLVKDTAGWVGVIASTVGIPVVPLVAKIIEKAPLGSFETWLRSRATDDEVSVAVTVAPIPDPAALKPGIEIKALKVGELLRQYEKIQSSEPFFSALTSATAAAVALLEAFVIETSILSLRESYYIGLWPLFTLEWKARHCLTDVLGDSAAVSEVPELRLLIEAEVSGRMIDDIVANATGGPDLPMALGPTVKLFRASKIYEWPRAAGFRSGYVIGYAKRTDALGPLLGGVEPATEMISDQAAAGVEAERLIARLGQISVAGRDELTAAWMRTCEASELSPKRRAQHAASVISFLSRMQFPLLHIRDPDMRDALRPDIANIFASISRSPVITHQDLVTTLDELASAHKHEDVDRFNAAERHISLLTKLPSGRHLAEPVKRIIETLRPIAV